MDDRQGVTTVDPRADGLAGERSLPADERHAPGNDPGLAQSRADLKKQIEQKLYLLQFQTDSESHLVIIDQETCRHCPEKWCNYFCPAAVYEFDESSGLNLVAYEGCVECGTCRIGCPYRNIAWRYPRGGFGVQHRYG